MAFFTLCIWQRSCQAYYYSESVSVIVSVIPAYYTKEYREQNSNLPEINTRLTLTKSRSLLEIGRQQVKTDICKYNTGCLKKTVHSWETKTLGTSYSETTYLLDLKLWQQGVLMSNPCCQISTAYRLVVSGDKVPKVLVSVSVLRHPVHILKTLK